MKASIYETITSQIVTAIEEGASLYKMPWHRDRFDIASPSNVVTGRSYRGLNILTLWMTAEARRFSSGTWATYQQWQEKGCQVRKGEKAASVFFWRNLSQDESEQAESDEETRARFVARGYHVFNADQVEGYQPPVIPVLPESERIANAEAFLGNVPAVITHGASTPCFIPSADRVEMPHFASFKSASGYYAVLAHELTHWSGGKARLDRDLSGRFGSESYAVEELVAELGAAFITGRLGLPSDPRTDHAPYIQSWLKVLKSDARAIFTAASKAQAAVDYLASFQANNAEGES